ncbi:DUF5666 domain-containing protein [uncultured Photobacterium sp.]|uniref:DUF5666 domain-containing protein n=1 Tax=uncultured Photobacterium sp. TaxID=173973 RepID=UPI002624881A|nr:DUF5666 domain-containing protein [uncultured Photobacterium sp.]
MKNLVYAVVGSVLLSGCGGDSSESSVDGSGLISRINGTVDMISYTALQLSVNGHELDASDSDVSYNGQRFSFDFVTTGMQVEISNQNNTAQAIVLQPVVAGPVTALSADSTTVNGITFNFSASGVVIGDWVMLFALLHPDNTWSVTSLSKIDPLLNAEIEGVLSGVDQAGAGTALLGTVPVDYTNAIIEDGRTLANGMWVEIYGQFSDGRFIAFSIDIKDPQDFNGLEFEGVVTWVSDDKMLFEVAGHLLVGINANTVFDDGTVNSLQAGAVVELDLVQSGDSLVAAKVDFEDQVVAPDNLEFKVEGEASFSNGQVSINGIPFDVNAGTRFDDGLALNNLDGSWVELKGKNINNQFVLKEIELESRDNEISLEGPVESNTMWGYSASDNSLATFNGQWVDIECSHNGNDLTLCRLDLN